MPGLLHHTLRALPLILSALAVSSALHVLHLPAAWFFGPLIVSVFFALREWPVPRIANAPYLTAQAIIGATLGASFSPDTLAQIPGHLFVISIAVFSILLTSMLNGWMLTRWTRLDPLTAYLGTLPGGAGEMAALSDQLHADTRIVVVMQYIRLLIILTSLFFVTPWLGHELHQQARAAAAVTEANYTALILLTLAGYLAGRYTRIPAGTFLVPAVLYLGLVLRGVSLGQYPLALTAAADAIMGVRIGERFHPSTLAAIRALIPSLIGTTVALLLASVALAWWFAIEMSLDPLSAHLAATPGGLDSVAAVAAGLQANAAIILTIHLARLLSVLIIGPWLVRACAHWSRPGTHGPQDEDIP